MSPPFFSLDVCGKDDGNNNEHTKKNRKNVIQYIYGYFCADNNGLSPVNKPIYAKKQLLSPISLKQITCKENKLRFRAASTDAYRNKPFYRRRQPGESLCSAYI